MPATTPKAPRARAPRPHARRSGAAPSDAPTARGRVLGAAEAGRLVLTVLVSETLRWGAPFVGPLLALAAWAQGWIEEPSWVIVAQAALLAPLLLFDRRRRDVGAIGVALVAALAVWALDGLPALAVLAGGWFVASVLATSLLEVVGCLVPEL